MVELDPRLILAQIGIAHASSVTAVSGGWDTSLYRVEVDGRAYALRVFRSEQAATCAREAVVMRSLSAVGLPVPGVRGELVNAERPALLLDWCAGRTVLGEVRGAPWRVWSLGVLMGKALARIHARGVPAEVRDQVPKWSAGDALTADLLRAHGEAWQDALLHLDFHPLNVMCDRGQLTGVLDWANVRI